MAINSYNDLGNAYSNGQYWTGYLRRGGPALTAGIWSDLSYASGIPGANYYASTPLQQATFNAYSGIDTGPAVNAAGYTKYLHKVLLMPPATSIGQATFLIHDILAFYPFVDGDGGLQYTTPSGLTLRYGGVGTKLMIVSQGAGYGNSSNTIISYTNAGGTSGQIAQVDFTANANSAGQLVSSCTDATALTAGLRAGNPYIDLQIGDTSISSIDYVNMQTGVGGVACVAIVKPLGCISMQEQSQVPIEVDFAANRFAMPVIQDNAYIAMVCRCTTSATPATIHAEFSFVWG